MRKPHPQKKFDGFGAGGAGRSTGNVFCDDSKCAAGVAVAAVILKQSQTSSSLCDHTWG